MIERRSLLPDSTWLWATLWLVRVALGLSAAVLAATAQWVLALMVFGLLLLLILTVWFGERLRILPDLTEARRTYAEEARRRPGESWLRHRWRLLLRHLDLP